MILFDAALLLLTLREVLNNYNLKEALKILYNEKWLFEKATFQKSYS